MSGNFNNLYKSAGKYDGQQQYKSIFEVAMFSTTEGLTDNILMSLSADLSIKNPRVRKLIHQFSEILDVKQKNSICRLGTAKSKQNIFRKLYIMCSSISKIQGQTIIYARVKHMYRIGLYRIFRLFNHQ